MQVRAVRWPHIQTGIFRIFCGFCEEACPKDAIYLSETFAPPAYNRKNFIYTKDDLLIPDPKTQPEEYEQAKGLRELSKKN